MLGALGLGDTQTVLADIKDDILMHHPGDTQYRQAVGCLVERKAPKLFLEGEAAGVHIGVSLPVNLPSIVEFE